MDDVIDIAELYMKNEVEKVIVGDRIKEARIYRGLSQTELADGLGVTRQAVSKYEMSKTLPSSSIVAKLPRVLKFPIRYFFKEKNFKEKESSITYFRSNAIPKKTKSQLEYMIKLMDSEIVDFYLKYIQLPKLNIPKLEDIVEDAKCNYDRDEIMKISKLLREHWGLGDKPISDLAYTLQKNGFILSSIKINQDKTDGFSQWINSIPYIITSSNKQSAVRNRYDNAHELGHLILHRKVGIEEQASPSIERDADYFASEFLYPSNVFIREIQGLAISLETFIYLKEKWGISIQAIVRKCLDLEIISEDKYTYFQKRISAKGWRKKEPLDGMIKIEEPSLFKDATELLLENNSITKQDILGEIDMLQEDIISLCNLPKDFFDSELSNVIKLF
ncbi:putative Zn peptidase [Gottschalkia purinilytica]|uniref:Putative Zn peptidase n=1 Tax=Gottschalkia purinilytica TaxID=1503 RepID=A0A0L0WAJ5_GOTPU|nr:XRE family transcriptional regulator [Gottschalkia purinilytica]KNF08539.1 putative Zn peptidase [Gottschalkia purinilytica]